ncbi:MAG TPA: multicopper oxidase [Gaiellaceae bacterium]|nr:multicopper oxidase [Gaiellaceae bacterium]
MTGFTRRQLIVYGSAAGAGLFWRGAIPRSFAQPFPAAAMPTLDPASIPKYTAPLVIPPAMPRTARLTGTGGRPVDYYDLAVRQFSQQILPPGLPATTVWSYGSVGHAGSFNYPAFTIEAGWRGPVRVRWRNELVDGGGNYLPHLLPVDPTLHWANPPGGADGRDMAPDYTGMPTPGPYMGPVPIVTHLHGGEHTRQESDGYAEAWYTPAAVNIPPEYATTGTYYDVFKASSPLGSSWEPGTAVFEYGNDQNAAALWYHDHTLGMTRLNVYAGPAGFYMVRGGPADQVGGKLPGPAPAPGDPPGRTYYEIPLAIQDRSFADDGSLFYPDSREFFDGFAGPYIPDSDMAPIWNPEFFGETMLVNGRTWPYLEVEQRRYRFRILNGCNSRFLLLELSNGLPFWQIGSDGGFLSAPVELDRLLLSPAERADVIVDFTDVPAGTELLLLNLGPDEPFGGGEPDEDFDVADPDTTGQVMQLRVVPARGVDTSTPPSRLRLPRRAALPAASLTRQLSLNEVDSEVLEDVGPRAALLGLVNGDGEGEPLGWDDPITENPAVGATEIWELYNFTEDSHPIHIHEVQFEVVNREPIEGGEVRPPEPWETGRKDTVIANPDEITRIKARFGTPGLFVWHCHIVEHEDHEMMRPYRIG